MKAKKRLLILSSLEHPGFLWITGEDVGAVEKSQTLFETNIPPQSTVFSDLPGAMAEKNYFPSPKHGGYQGNYEDIKETVLELISQEIFTNAKKAGYVRVEPDQFLDVVNCGICDFYIHLPQNQKFLVFLPAGFELSAQRLKKLQEHPIPYLFLKQRDYDRIQNPEDSEEETLSIGKQETDKSVIEKLQALHRSILHGNTQTPQKTLEDIKDLSFQMVQDIAPTGTAIERLVQETIKNIDQMNDIKAISALTVMFSMASNIMAPHLLQELAMACMLMDISLANVNNDMMNSYYLKQPLDQELQSKFDSHAVQSLQIAKTRLPHLNDAVKDLIAIHHDKLDGSGYPIHNFDKRRLQMAQILSFAVETFETYKGEKLQQGRASLENIFRRKYQEYKTSKKQKNLLSLLESLSIYLQIDLNKKAA